MSTSYGITDYERTACTTPFSLWSGPFFSVWEADGIARDGVHSVTMTDYSGEKFTVKLPEGITFPRTQENYRQIDAAISAAYKKHNARLGRIQMEAPA